MARLGSRYGTHDGLKGKNTSSAKSNTTLSGRVKRAAGTCNKYRVVLCACFPSIFMKITYLCFPFWSTEQDFSSEVGQY
jgi:hypothetical protein